MRVKWSGINIGKEELKAIKSCLKKKDISGFSPLIKKFENEALKYTSNKYAVACSNGTVALIAAFLAIKNYYNKKKLKIAVPSWSYIAPANAADFMGELSLIDSDRDTHNINYKDPKLKKSDIICAVDMAGVPSNYKNLKKFKKIIVSDAAESFGSIYNATKKIGSDALITTTSFQVSKIITTGEGGMIFTSNKKIYNICKLIINQGYGKGGYNLHDHVYKGFNFRITGIQAALGIEQLKKIKKFLNKRKKIFNIYNTRLNKVLEPHKIPFDSKSSYYSYVCLLKNNKQRNLLKKYLKEKKIETKLWKPIHLYKPYIKFKKNNFKNCNHIYNHHLRLPINNLTTEKEAHYVCDRIVEFFKNV